MKTYITIIHYETEEDRNEKERIKSVREWENFLELKKREQENKKKFYEIAEKRHFFQLS